MIIYTNNFNFLINLNFNENFYNYKMNSQTNLKSLYLAKVQKLDAYDLDDFEAQSKFISFKDVFNSRFNRYAGEQNATFS